MKIIEINCETGEETIRDMTAEELAEHKKMASYIPGKDELETI